MSEAFVIAGAIVSSIVASSIWSGWNIYQNKKQLKDMNKIASANLIMQLHEPWRKNDDFKKLLRQINDKNIVKYDEQAVSILLNKLDEIGTFWKDEVLSDKHIKEYFGTNLRKIKKDADIQKILAQKKKDDHHIYKNLDELLNKVDMWY